MMKSLTIAYITGREEPCFDWFIESLEKRVAESKIAWKNLRIIVVDRLRRHRPAFIRVPTNALHVNPKPTVWQGEGRLTKQDWWAAANARNTALCLCETDWIAFLDDRCVIEPGWFEPVLQAQKDGYVVAGTYEKRHDMTAYGGFIRHGGTITGRDSRAILQEEKKLPNPMPCGGEWLFGCNFALPLEWALEVNGVDEFCDGLSMEDCVFGIHLQNSGKPIKFDHRMKIIEDRTPEKATNKMIRRDKGVSPKDKSHAMLERLRNLKKASHPLDIRKIRDQALRGFGFPPAKWPTHDWWDNQPLGEMVPG